VELGDAGLSDSVELALWLLEMLDEPLLAGCWVVAHTGI